MSKISSKATNYSNNLIDNGDFELGNIGFITEYTYCNSSDCLGPLGNNGYAIGKNATYYHSLFKGTDHSSGTGNFMIINGADPQLTVWKKKKTIT